jgi:hypothetical protein
MPAIATLKAMPAPDTVRLHRPTLLIAYDLVSWQWLALMDWCTDAHTLEALIDHAPAIFTRIQWG